MLFHDHKHVKRSLSNVSLETGSYCEMFFLFSIHNLAQDVALSNKLGFGSVIET